ncbi:MAG: GspE/PulE family protein [Candidatus Gracilibacteria bacterium]
MAEDNKRTKGAQMNVGIGEESDAGGGKAAYPTSLGQGNLQINREFQEKDVIKRAKDLDMPYVNIGKMPLNPDFIKMIDLESAVAARIIPFYRIGKTVRVAIDDPNNPKTVEAIKVLEGKGYTVSKNLASNSGMDEGLAAYQNARKYKKIEVVKKVATENIKTYEKEIADLAKLSEKLGKVTAEEALNMLNLGAMKTGASDMHLEPDEKSVKVRLRIDGMLHPAFEMKHEIFNRIAEQIKYQSRMRLNVMTVPQDGRYDFTFNDQQIDVRVSTIWTPYGESFVCRFLINGGESLEFEELGFQGNDLAKIQNAVKISHGMILVTGPTGSGKTTTLYSILKKIKTPQNNIITLEDPIEYHIDGVTQSQIDEKNGYDFADGLRAILRHDPNVIMIGEIRDLETAEAAAQASLTGHVLLTTLHTNSAMESFPRLTNMGLPAFMVAPSIHTIIAQRLVRKICPKCSKMEAISDSEAKEFNDAMIELNSINPQAFVTAPSKVARVYGCDFCSQTGYKGRMVISEIVHVNEQMKTLILNKKSSVELIEAARKNGLTTMREDGYFKVAKGLTTFEEVHRVTNFSI